MARRRGRIAGSGRTARTVLVVALAAALAAPAAGWVSVQASSAVGSYDPAATGGDAGGGVDADAGTPTSSGSTSPASTSAPAGSPSAAADADPGSWATGGRDSSAAAPPAPPPSADAGSPRLRVVDATRPLPAAPAVPAPTRLRVPSLGIDAPVDAVGVLPDGTAEIPEDAQRVGWYRFGPVPGADRGAAVIVGHRDARGQGPGALYGLGGIGVGDTLTVARRDGAALTYRVVERRRWEKQAVPLERLYARSGPPRLVVITCGGAYDPDRGGYQDNVVVTAVPVR